MSSTLRRNQAPLQLLQRFERRADARAVTGHGSETIHAGWLERLAAWADRQPVHHRMGSLDALRSNSSVSR